MESQSAGNWAENSVVMTVVHLADWWAHLLGPPMAGHWDSQKADPKGLQLVGSMAL